MAGHIRKRIDSKGKVTYQFSAGDNYVYCTNSNNGVRVGTNNNNVFSIYDNEGVDFLFNEATSRYVGVYNSQDWRCYTSINANIKNNVLAFYKKTEDASDTRTATTVTISDPVLFIYQNLIRLVKSKLKSLNPKLKKSLILASKI